MIYNTVHSSNNNARAHFQFAQTIGIKLITHIFNELALLQLMSFICAVLFFFLVSF